MWSRVYRMDDGLDLLVDDDSETRRDAEKVHAMSMRAADDFGFIPVRDINGDIAYVNLNHVLFVTFEERDDQ